LELRELISGDFVVHFIFPGLVAASSALQEGDIITPINGIKAKDISLDAWLSLTNILGKYEVCWQVFTATRPSKLINKREENAQAKGECN
jgi:hypothetical protein